MNPELYLLIVPYRIIIYSPVNFFYSTQGFSGYKDGNFYIVLCCLINSNQCLRDLY